MKELLFFVVVISVKRNRSHAISSRVRRKRRIFSLRFFSNFCHKIFCKRYFMAFSRSPFTLFERRALFYVQSNTRLTRMKADRLNTNKKARKNGAFQAFLFGCDWLGPGNEWNDIFFLTFIPVLKRTTLGFYFLIIHYITHESPDKTFSSYLPHFFYFLSIIIIY
jgi:hypothetical protein